jgi:hypothetical protein
MAQGMKLLNHGHPVATRKVGAEGYLPKMGVSSASSDMDPIGLPEEIRGPSFGIVSTHVRYRMSYPTALVPQLQMWHLHWSGSI